MYTIIIMSVKLRDRRNLTCSDLKFMSKVANNPDLPDVSVADVPQRKKVLKKRSFKYGLSHSAQDLRRTYGKAVNNPEYVSYSVRNGDVSEKLKRTTLEPGFDFCQLNCGEHKYKAGLYGRLLNCFRKLRRSLGIQHEKSSRFLKFKYFFLVF